MKDHKLITETLSVPTIFEHDLPTDCWPTCSNVVCERDTLIYSLDFNRSYYFGDAVKDAHVEFVQCHAAGDFVSFFKRWGPLRLNRFVTSDEKSIPLKQSLPFSYVASIHKNLLNTLRLKESFKRGENNLREVSMDLVRSFLNTRQLVESLNWLDFGWHEPLNPPWLTATETMLSQFESFYASGQMNDSLTFANFVRELLSAILNLPISPQQLTPIWQNGKGVLEQSFQFKNLEEALQWMIWQDEWSVRPVLLCENCGKPFSQGRAKRFCSIPCGHNAVIRRGRTRQKGSKLQRVLTIYNRLESGKPKTDWKKTVCEKADVTSTWLTRTINAGNLPPTPWG